jgi:hypothetical protein
MFIFKVHFHVVEVLFCFRKMARNFEFIKDINDRKDLWKIAVKVRDKWTSQKEGKEYLELVVVDSKVSFF